MGCQVPRSLATELMARKSSSSLILPPDDVGSEACFLPPGDAGDPGLFQPPQEPKPRNTNNVSVAKKPAAKTGAKAKPVLKRPAAKNKVEPSAPVSTEGNEEDTAFPWNDERLSDAAARFDSVAVMPYEDLRELHANPPQIQPQRCSLWEIYSLPRLSPMMREIGGRSLRSYDLKHFVDLSQKDYVRLLLQDVALYRPYYLSLSPPCTKVCQLQASNWKRMKGTRKKYMDLEEALGHIDLTMWLATFQDDTGSYYGFEHPEKSLAWKRESVTMTKWNNT